MPQNKIPTPLKLLRGNPGKQRIYPEPTPEPLAELPDPPPFLKLNAQTEWRRLVGQLHHMRLLTALDLPALAAFCSAYADWIEAEESLAVMAARDPLFKAKMVRGAKGTFIMNPLVRIAAQARLDMVRFAAEFGLTPAARSRIAMGWDGPQKPGKFDGLLAS